MDSAPISGSNFKYEKLEGADDKMVEFSKMAILLAFEEYPNDDDTWKRAGLVREKFEEKYGGEWLVSLIKNGDVNFWYRRFYLKLKYKDYNIKIGKTSYE